MKKRAASLLLAMSLLLSTPALAAQDGGLVSGTQRQLVDLGAEYLGLLGKWHVGCLPSLCCGSLYGFPMMLTGS